ncbi:MAG: DNA repair protein RadA, partial [Eudoraea sp.]|nr:DNA repair protein RadA [Eudoraea sp.]
MAKTKTAFFCQNCGTQYAKWVGQCGACKEWNTVVEEVIKKEKDITWQNFNDSKTTTSKPVLVGQINTSSEFRLDIYDKEFNRVLGGGLV